MEELQQTIKEMVIPGKGILAADESTGTATKRLASINVESTEETRRQYRNLILTAPGMEDYILGVILFEETLAQKSDGGVFFPQILQQKGIVPGIKVDQGMTELEGTSEKYTKGLEGLPERLREYKKLGARFTKWRAAYQISGNTPSNALIKKNAENLAKYAKICQDEGFVPIVEPEVLMDGNHNIDTCEKISLVVFKEVFDALAKEGVSLPHIILKPSMVISGKDAENRATPQEVAERTIKVLKETVPGEVPSINFLSGGQTPEEATTHLNEMNKLGELPWYVSFSYGRALQEYALKTWQGKNENLDAGQQAFIKRAKLNGLATKGEYKEDMEKSS